MIKSLAKALQVLKLFTVEKDTWSAQEIETALDYHKSSVQRILATLEAEDFLQRVDESRSKYKLGNAVFILGRVAEGEDLRTIALPYLEKLTELTRETAHLCVADENECLYIAKVDSPNSIRMVTKIGVRLPLHATAVGKMLLSGMSEEQVDEVISQKGLEPSTKHTITTREDLYKELEAIRETGLSHDREEREIGLRCVAAPVRDRTGNIIAAISISGPSMRMTQDVIPEYSKYVKEIASEISYKLGNRETNDKE